MIFFSADGSSHAHDDRTQSHDPDRHLHSLSGTLPIDQKKTQQNNTHKFLTILRTDIDLVTTQVAMALGASVHPFTKITPSVRSTANISSGLSIICPQK